jgi:hypothetical protein
MCFNQTTSLAAFSISVVCCIYLICYGITHNNNYDILAGIITILIGLMQLIEYFLWKYQDCSIMNHYFSLMIVVVLYLQGVIGSISFMYLLINKTEKWLSKWILTIIVMYTLFIIYLLSWLNERKLCSKSENCRLEWSPFQIMYNDFFGRILLMWFLFFYIILGNYFVNGMNIFTNKNFEGYKKYPIRYSIFTSTIIIGLIYSIITNGKDFVDIFGTSWCFLTVAFGIVSCLHI